MNIQFEDKNLSRISEKIACKDRLNFDDGVALYNTQDIIGLGRLADIVRRYRHGNKAFYICNRHLNYTNVCINRCLFCAFARDEGQEGAFTLSIQDIRKQLEDLPDKQIREFHIVGGLNPSLPFEYYIDLIKTVREIQPQATIKAFSAVEIDYLSRISGGSLSDTINMLKNAGLAMIPGGGAEVMSERVWQKLFPKKIGMYRWLEVMEAIHSAGIMSNATMLYGHIETIEERVSHLMRLRALQDKTHGFSAFIPLAFHSKNTKLSHIPPTTAFDDLKNIAAARLMLDNFDHIKAYWVMIGEKLAQTALSFGADDLDGTIVEEKITHMAGANSAKGLTVSRMKRLIQNAGFTPVERDSFYNHSDQWSVVSGQMETDHRLSTDKRIEFDEALYLYHNADLLTLGEVAGEKRRQIHPDRVVTFVVDRNINYTNVCVSGCLFCAFFRNLDHPESYVISKKELEEKIAETKALGGTQILLQGGMNPGLDFSFYLDMLKFIKTHFDIHIHGFSPPEIVFMAKKSGNSISDTIKQLKSAGLDSIPGGGAEILSDHVRKQISPNKCTADEWIAVMRTAHGLGLRTTATMMFGHIEKPEHIIEHLLRIRNLQDETHGFTAFIPWTFQPENTRINVLSATSVEYLRVLALSRIVLDNVQNIQASWVTQGDKIAQAALAFGANDLGSTMIEENVVAAAGVRFRLPKSEMIRLIKDAGYMAVQRDCFYNHLAEA